MMAAAFAAALAMATLSAADEPDAWAACEACSYAAPSPAAAVPEKALVLIRAFEGYRAHAYRDPRPGDPIWTIGYGHTGRDVRRGDVMSLASAEHTLRLDAAAAAHAVRQLVRVPLAEHEEAALIALAFNVGAGALARSSILRALHRGDKRAALSAWLRYCHAGKPPRVLPGLLRRRIAEAKLFAGQP